MKKLVWLLGGVIAVGVVAWLVGSGVPPPPPTPPSEKIEHVPVVWENVPRMAKTVLTKGDAFGDLTLTTPLAMKSIYPHSKSLSERYPEQMKLIFEGRGKKGESELRVCFDVVAYPSVVAGDELTLVFTNFVPLASETFDVASGKKIDASVSALETAAKNALSSYVLRIEGVPGFAADNLPTRIWVRNDGLECKVKAERSAK